MTVIIDGTTGIQSPDGSGTAPSYSNDGDGNTGVFFPAADTVAISTAGSERARVDSAGNMGLGVTPSAWTNTAHIGRVLQAGNASYFGRTDNSDAYVGSNVYRDTSDWKRIATGSAALLQQSGSTHYLYGVASGSADAAITWTQLAQVGLNGSLALQGATSQTGTGITFPATQNASSNANTLDDYEEGDWTPSVIGNTSAGTTTYGSVRYGKYTKIGRQVSITCRVDYTAMTGTGYLRISGIPFASSGTNGESVGAVMTNGADWVSNGSFAAYMGSNSTTVEFYVSVDDAGWTILDAANESNSFIFSLTYYV